VIEARAVHGVAARFRARSRVPRLRVLSCPPRSHDRVPKLPGWRQAAMVDLHHDGVARLAAAISRGDSGLRCRAAHRVLSARAATGGVSQGPGNDSGVAGADH
jgi:hypothetical protein